MHGSVVHNYSRAGRIKSSINEEQTPVWHYYTLPDLTTGRHRPRNFKPRDERVSVGVQTYKADREVTIEVDPRTTVRGLPNIVEDVIKLVATLSELL
ncbi:hypothetical protein Pmar_PMAR012037 [Perkinsus marinus ATCC 50983]|uniref:Uncharacterized protein n=1 Tax=Perkinsus marinus (strain ATCC 50983 / TXsc) TaxID=423536 RepID=C5LW92_PERM5|nr:hypothetical protein Pmar_PMAR012037 [Perkinsus marinus ATCC 50983]EEQ99029.1 hypothetical protein Pmar_PMAR012037 [Perkinsus marinus ATCC 50983]|eukprot:XP_002766312.1 hypothetical protein Pmar_PMAR012037 [Perkinsus marinus ATCC 50983]